MQDNEVIINEYDKFNTIKEDKKICYYVMQDLQNNSTDSDK